MALLLSIGTTVSRVSLHNWDQVARLDIGDGDRVLIGTTTRLGTGKTNLWLARVARSGAVRWERGYGSP